MIALYTFTYHQSFLTITYIKVGQKVKNMEKHWYHVVQHLTQHQIDVYNTRDPGYLFENKRCEF